MSNLILLCGKPGCGKTTLANNLTEEFKLVHLSADDFMLKLFGEIVDRELFNVKLRACKDKIYELCEQLLSNDVDVVLDFGFWSKEERSNIRNRFKKYNVHVVYLKVDDESIFARIENRNKKLKENEYYMDKNTFTFLSSLFEEPKEDENVVVYKSYEDLQVKLLNCNLTRR